MGAPGKMPVFIWLVVGLSFLAAILMRIPYYGVLPCVPSQVYAVIEPCVFVLIQNQHGRGGSPPL